MLSFLTDLFKPQPPKAPDITDETSMNFDRAEVAPFLSRLVAHPRLGLPQAMPGMVDQGLNDLAVDQTRIWTIDGELDGGPIQIRIEAFMDDIDAPDLSFYSSAQATALIEAELTRFDQDMRGGA